MVIEMGSNQFLANINGGDLSLTIIEGPAHSLSIEIPKQGKTTIGRKPNNLINFPHDQHLSNIHATISYSDNKFYIEDMGTTNGTWERLSMEAEASEQFEIRDKTVFKIGSNQTYVCKIKMALVSQRMHPNACVICCDSDKDCVYLPCKHNTACIKCSKNLKECPICRVTLRISSASTNPDWMINELYLHQGFLIKTINCHNYKF